MTSPQYMQVEKAYRTLRKSGTGSDLRQIGSSLFVKTDCLLPGQSYKTRGVRNFFANNNLVDDCLCVLSAGNLALATALECRTRGIPCTAVVPIEISEAKEQLLLSAGAQIEKRRFQDIWEMVLMDPAELITRSERILHPLHPDLLSGYGSVLSETLDQLKNCEAIVVPYGLGGLTLGIVRAIRAMKSDIKLFVVEITGHAPLKSAIEADMPRQTPKLTSFIEVLGTPIVISQVFSEIKDRIAGVVTVTEREVADEIRWIASHLNLRIEGAAGAAVAAAKKITDQLNGPSVALLTGGNISPSIHDKILGRLDEFS